MSNLLHKREETLITFYRNAYFIIFLGSNPLRGLHCTPKIYFLFKCFIV
nr:MAG TPA: hypothetical protein [Caudoviricetes sp.]